MTLTVTHRNNATAVAMDTLNGDCDFIVSPRLSREVVGEDNVHGFLPGEGRRVFQLQRAGESTAPLTEIQLQFRGDGPS